MVKYFCNKCGLQIGKGMLKVVAADERNENKKTYHLCSKCSKEFDVFMSLLVEQVQTVVVESTGNLIKEEKPASDTESNSNSDDKIIAEMMAAVYGDKLEETVVGADNETNNEDKAEPESEVEVKPMAAPKSKENHSIRQKAKHLTQEIKDYIDNSNGNESATSIANKFGIPYQSVYQYMKSTGKKSSDGIVEAKASDNLTANEVGTAIALRRAGWAVKTIAYEIGKDQESVEAALRRNGMLR